MTFKRILFSFLILMFSGASYSALFDYKFTGTVSSYNDTAGIIAGAGYDLSSFETQTVEYIYRIDFGLPGTFTRYDGVTESKNDSNGFYDYDYFYTSFMSGSLIESIDGGSHNNAQDKQQYNYGYSKTRVGKTDFGKIFGESFDDLTYVRGAQRVQDWDSTTTLTGFERAYDSAGLQSYFYSNLVLESITEVPSVTHMPVPAAFWLFGTALLGFVGFSRRTVVN